MIHVNVCKTYKKLRKHIIELRQHQILVCISVCFLYSVRINTNLICGKFMQ